MDGSSGDGGPATAANSVLTDRRRRQSDGGFLVADAGAHRVRRVMPNGTIFRVAGTGTPGSSGDGGWAVMAQLYTPVGVATLPDGGFLVTEWDGNRVRRVSPSGTITTVAGTGTAGYSGDGGAGTAARINKPVFVSTTADGGFLIGDSLNGRVRKVSADGTIATLARVRSASAAVENAAGTILIADNEDNRLWLVEGPRPPAVPPPPPRCRIPSPRGRARAGGAHDCRASPLPRGLPPTATTGARGTIRLVLRSSARAAAAAGQGGRDRARRLLRGARVLSKVVKVRLTRAGRRVLRKRRQVTVTAVVARRGGPNIGQSSTRTTVKVKRKHRHPGMRTA